MCQVNTKCISKCITLWSVIPYKIKARTITCKGSEIFQMNAMHDLKFHITVNFLKWPFRRPCGIPGNKVDHLNVWPDWRSFNKNVLDSTYHLEKTEVLFALLSGLGLGNHLHWTIRYCLKSSVHTHYQVKHFRSDP